MIINNFKHKCRHIFISCKVLFRFLFSFLMLFSFGVVLVSNASAQDKNNTDFKFHGDFRLRYENTENEEQGQAISKGRHREVVRFRAGLTKQINESINFGARIATGSSDDPNTADVTLGNFLDDLEISLDQLYVEWAIKNLLLTGGKFPNPFRKTDLVWDGDVNPQGMAGSFKFAEAAKISGIFFIIDEHSSSKTPDSQMLGGQVDYSVKPSEKTNFTIAGGYYDYDITRLTESHSDAGDTRSNNILFDSSGTATAYLSDFNLLDIIAIIEYNGFGEKYPLRFVADFVKNLKAEVEQDKGFMLDLFIGRASALNDIRLGYGYAQAETDAVLAAFSNDNTTIATNYIQHTLTFNYVMFENTMFDLTWYYYKNKEKINATNEYISRLRLNMIITL